jgi:CTP synthase (UTP-ammonia lyase)
VQAHQRIPGILDALREHEQLIVDAYWIPTTETGSLKGFDGIWLLPGSPYASEAGALAAVRDARESGVPFFGTCGGFQHALLEYARNVCGVDADHAENTPDGENFVVIALACSLAGHQGTVHIRPGSRAERILGDTKTFVHYLCSYGVNPAYLGLLTQHGLEFTGHDDNGDVRIAELPEHPFFLATLFQPELHEGPRPHSLIRAFAEAAAENARAKSAPAAV